MVKIKSTSFFLLVLGFLVGVVFSIFGLQFIATHIAVVAAITGGIIVLIALIGVLLYAFREPLLKHLYGYATTEIESLAKPASQMISNIAVGNSEKATQDGEQLLREFLSRYSWMRTQRWIVGTAIAILGTFAALGGSALVFRQNELISKQNELLEAQNKALRIENQPQFVLDKSYEFDENNVAAEDILTIKNISGFYRELDVEVKTFILASYTSNEPPNIIDKRIAISAYYFASFISPEGIGKVRTMKGTGRNNERFFELQKSYRQLCRSQNGIGSLELLRFAKLEYTDIYGERHTNYYFINEVSNSTIIEFSEGNSVFEEWENQRSTFDSIDFDEITAQLVLEKVLSGD